MPSIAPTLQPYPRPAPASAGRSLIYGLAWFALALGLGTWLTLDLIPGAYRHLPGQGPGLDLGCVLLASRLADEGISPYKIYDKAAGRRPDAVQAVARRIGYDDGGLNVPFIYPPTLLILLRGMPDNLTNAHQWLMALNGLALLSLGWFGWRWRSEAPYAFAAGVILLTCLGRAGWSNFWLGQVNLLLGVGTLWSIRCLASGRLWVRGVGALLAGLGFWIKLYTVAFAAVQGLARPAARYWATTGICTVGLAVWLAEPALMTDWIDFMKDDNGKAAFIKGVGIQGYTLTALADALAPDPARGYPLAVALKVGALALLGLCFLPSLRMLVSKHQPAGIQPNGLYLPMAVAIFLLAPISWDHHLAFYAGPAGLGLAAVWLGGPGRPQAVVLALLTGLWLACPRIPFHTHNFIEVLAGRLATLAALGVLAWYAWITVRRNTSIG